MENREPPSFLLPRPAATLAEVRLLKRGGFFDAILQTIDDARQYVYCEFYIFRSDETGFAVADRLAAAVGRGVRVYLIYDSVGALGDSEAVIDYMIEHGIKVMEYHPILFRRKRWTQMTLFRRNHRKLLVADGASALLGSANIGDEYRFEAPTSFYDIGVELRGAIVPVVARAFLRVWNRNSRLKMRLPEWPEPAGTDRQPRAQLLTNRDRRGRRAIEAAYLRAIHHAQDSVFIANAYFVPNQRIRAALYAAVRRGVDVRLLLPVVNNRHPVHLAGSFFYGRLLNRGIRIWQWRESILHAKCAVVDKRWALVGSYNFDALSLHRNLEIAVAVEDHAFAKALGQSFKEDFSRCEEIEIEAWSRRSRWRRILQWLAHKLNDWL